MKKIMVVLGFLGMILAGLWLLGSSALEAMRLQAELEQWRAVGSLAQTSQSLAGTTWLLGLAVAGLGVVNVALLAMLFGERRRRNEERLLGFRKREQALRMGPRPELPERAEQERSPIDQLVQLQMIDLMGRMQERRERRQLPAWQEGDDD